MYNIFLCNFQSSFFLDKSSVTYSGGKVLTVERRTYRPSGYGSDSGGGDTLGLLQYLHNRFGPVTSFSGSYRADSWVLHIDRNNNSAGMLLMVQYGIQNP